MNIQSRIKTAMCAAGKTLSVAESCTGGQISHLLTTVPGASAYYLGSVTSYAVEIKERILGVPAGTVRKYGVVSAEVAEAMAEGVKSVTGSDYAVSTTGLAGPGGDDDGNPEGTVWIGIAGPFGKRSVCKHFKGSRDENIRHFALAALKELEKSFPCVK